MLEAVKSNLEALSGQIGKPTDKLIEEFEKVLKAPPLQKLDQHGKEYEALRVLRARHMKQIMPFDNSKNYEVIVIDHSMPKKIMAKGEETSIANAFIFAKVKDKPNFARCTFWREAASEEQMSGLEIGQIFDTKLVLTKTGGAKNPTIKMLDQTEIYSFSCNRDNVFSSKGKSIDVLKLIKEKIPELKVDDGLDKLMGVMGKDILVRISGTVARYYVGEGDNGKYGVLNIIPDDLDFVTAQEVGGGITVYVGDNQIRYGYPTHVQVIGRVIQSNQTGEPVMSGEAVVLDGIEYPLEQQDGDEELPDDDEVFDEVTVEKPEAASDDDEDDFFS